MNVAVLPLHMGSLHPFEQALTLLLAFGPFAVLAIVLRRRGKELAADEQLSDQVPAPEETSEPERPGVS